MLATSQVVSSGVLYGMAMSCCSGYHASTCSDHLVMDGSQSLWTPCGSCCLSTFSWPTQATQISPWIVTLDALEPFRCEAEQQQPDVLPYLSETTRHTWDINLTAAITPAGGSKETQVTDTNLKHL